MIESIDESSTVSVPFGRGSVSFHLPKGAKGHILHSKGAPALGDPLSAIEQSLDHPLQSPPLQELARPGSKVCVVFTDVTRASPDRLLIPPMLQRLESAGVRREDITLLCAVGLHRSSTKEEKVEKLGEGVVNAYRVVDHDALDAANLVHVGDTSEGVPIVVNRCVAESDLVIASGLVEPHQYAGYSGGAKTTIIGAGGEPTIAATHGVQMIDRPGVRLGRIDGNPFQEAVREGARFVPLKLILNVVKDENGRIAAVAAGDPIAVHDYLVSKASQIYTVPVPQKYDVVVAGVGYPKDANLYQASRAASYIFFAPKPVVKPGGAIIVPAPCQEGVGRGTGEKRFGEAMAASSSPRELVEKARREGLPAGAQRAFIMAKVMSEVKVVIAGAEAPEIVRKTKFEYAPTVDAALEEAQKNLGHPIDVLVVPHALLTLPYLAEKTV